MRKQMREELIVIINDALASGASLRQADHVLASLEAAGFKVVKTGKTNATGEGRL
jgi:hypothetical protein